MSSRPTVHDDEKPASAKSTGLVALAVMSSRVLGLVREMMFASYFDGGLRDTFIAAFRLPNLLAISLRKVLSPRLSSPSSVRR
ncbi:MAG: hypothetical protein ACK5CW_05525 [Verrucomicrobiota bacterium]